MANESPETLYVGYTAAELAAQAQAEYQALADLKRLTLEWQARASRQARAYSEALEALQVVSSGWKAASEAPAAPFLLTRRILRGKVAPKSAVRRRPAYMSQFFQAAMACLLN